MKLEVNKEKGRGGGWVKGGRIVGSNTRLSASNHKNNFPQIMFVTEVRSLNYSLSIVYREPIPSSFFSVHLAASPLAIYLSHSVSFAARIYNPSKNIM